eukprot:807501-Rhodomonas_salina.3
MAVGEKRGLGNGADQSADREGAARTRGERRAEASRTKHLQEGRRERGHERAECGGGRERARERGDGTLGGAGQRASVAAPLCTLALVA